MGHRADMDQLWPVRQLRVRTARLELRLPDEALLAELAELAAAPIHDPAAMPFLVPWTDGTPDERRRSTLQFHWRTASELSPERWHLAFVTIVEGRVVGTQSLMAEQLPLRRTVTTGSWITRSEQGRGIGREMRAAVLHLAFAELGALRAETGAWEDNPASLAVTRHLGYRPNGERVLVRRGRPARELHFVLDRETWAASPRIDVEVTGLAACRRLLGADG